ncbi:MAG: tetratricopeptide repeat protein [Chlorobiales bacterium]|nr:tetratricopeptide repeat protein [Chlorobiales bacterium]
MIAINQHPGALLRITVILFSSLAVLVTAGCDSASKELNELQQAVWRSPEDPQAYIRLGNAYARQKQYDKAVDSYEKALALNPRSGMTVYPALGAAYFNRKQYEQALGYFRKSLEFSPDDSLRHYDIGNVYLQLDKYDLAIEAYLEAIANSTAFEEAYYNLAICYIRTGQRAKAREIYAWLQDKNNYLAVSLERHLEKEN